MIRDHTEIQGYVISIFTITGHTFRRPTAAAATATTTTMTTTTTTLHHYHTKFQQQPHYNYITTNIASITTAATLTKRSFTESAL